MVLIKFRYQLVREKAKTKVFQYEKLLDNCEAKEILDGIEDGLSFNDILEDGCNCLIRVREEIMQILLKATDFNTLYRQYGTQDPFEVFDLRIDFDSELYQSSMGGDDES